MNSWPHSIIARWINAIIRQCESAVGIMEYCIILLLLSFAKFAIGMPSEPVAVHSSTSGPDSSDHFPTIVVSAPQSKGTGNISLGFDLPTCRAEYGSNMSKASCLNAWQSIPPNLQKRRYGRRTQGIFDAPLPQRYLSGMHSCFGELAANSRL